MRRKLLPARFAGVTLQFVLSAMMSFIVSGVATLRSAGYSDTFVSKWMSAWGPSWLIAFLALFIAMPLARRLVSLLVETP